MKGRVGAFMDEKAPARLPEGQEAGARHRSHVVVLRVAKR